MKLFLGSPCPSIQVSAPFSTILGTLGRAQNVFRLGALSVPSTIVDNDSTNLL